MLFRKLILITFLFAFQAWGQGIVRAETLVATNDPASRPRRILYFAQQNNTHHRPSDFLNIVREEFGQRGIILETSILTSKISDVGLSGYDAVYFYGNHNTFSSASQQAIVDYVENGGGIIGMHVFAYVVRNSPLARNLLGGGFLTHYPLASFTPLLIQSPAEYPSDLDGHAHFPFPNGGTYASDPDHPILQGLETYTSIDEPYLLTNFNPDLILLGYRADVHGWAEPYTWVRHQGLGRVFYHANGHDYRSWNQPNFQDLMIRGTNWVAKTDGAGPFHSLYPPVISSDGTIQHFASIGTTNLALYSGTHQTSVNNGQIPGDAENLRYEFTEPSPHHLFEDGHVAFHGTIVESGGTSVSALFAGHPRYPTIIAKIGGEADVLEAGFLFQDSQTFSFKANRSGSLVYYAKIQDTAGLNQRAGLVLQSGSAANSLLAEGSPLSADPTLTVHQLHDTQFAFSESSTIALIAELEDDLQVISSHLVAGGPATLSSWLHEGSRIDEASPTTTISEFQSATPLNSDTLVFTATTTGSGEDSSNDQIIASVNSSGGITLLLREGDLINAETISFSSGEILTQSHQNRTIAFGSISNDSALFEIAHEGSPSLLLREGQTLNIEGSVRIIATIDGSSLMTSQGHLVVPVTLQATNPTSPIKCLLHIGPAGIPQAIMMEDWQVTTSTGILTVAEIECHAADLPGSGINASGTAAFLVSDEIGNDAIVKISNLDDLDQDGISDTIETAFGGNPETFSNQRPPGFPKIIRFNQTEIDFSFWQIQDSPLTANYRLEVSTDLVIWTDAQASFTADPDQSGVPAPYLRMTTTVPASTTACFYRFSL